MRNLKSVRLQETEIEGDLPLTATAWDTSSDSIVCTFGPAEHNPVIELRRKRPEVTAAEPLSRDALECIASWDAPSPLPDLACDRVLSLHYFADNLSACLVLEGGDIIIVREEPLPGEDKIEILGSVDVGITAAAWSPDEELLAITTRARTFLYMTREFENVAEITFSEADLQASQHVSVGWGKRETQFQGKRAKAMRDPTVPEKVDEGKLSSNDDSRTTISWRGDGAYVAVNTVDEGIRRVVRVYSREGTLDSVSEPVDGLEGALSWRPSGNLIAGIQRLDDRIDVVFFERNGLRHGQFTLRLTEEERQSWASQIQLSWNVDSTVLAVRFKDRVQLWTTGNYHYYLKQEIPIVVDPACSLPFSFEWHQEKALRLVAGSSDSVLDLDYVFDIHHGSTAIPDDVGAVAVIDGRTLKLTPLRLAGVPPPMAHNELQLDSNVIDVAFSKSGTRMAVLMDKRFSIFLWSLKSRPVPVPIMESSYPLPDSPYSRPRQIVFLNETEVYILKDSAPGISHIERTTLETRETQVSYQAKAFEELYSIFAGVGHSALWISHAQQPGLPASYSTIDFVTGGEVEATLWSESPTVETHWARAVSISDDERILITLTRTGTLYADKRVLAKNCTSFLVTPSHLLFTTSQHLLKFVHLNRVDDMEVPEDTPETDERCRSIERGSKLVSVIPSIFAVVLQAPRGNIETIFPRALVLAGIRTFIDRKNYRAAFLACRSQMVDMNILHDYAPQQFMESVQLFVEQVKKIEFIDDFLSRLKEEDVSQTLYKDTLKISKYESAVVAHPDVPTVPSLPQLAGKTSKVNAICDAFLAVLQTRIDTNLQNLVTAHVCKDPPDLEAGLKLVANLRTQNSEQAQDAIEHMCFLTDANRLYSHALGLYDLELTLLVAQQAQMDPREYLPFLRKLQQLPETRRQFEIDNHLARFDKALKHLFALGVHEEIRAYVSRHALYKEALEIYKYQPEQLREITQIYADYLQNDSKHKDAAIAYESLGIYDEAYKCYNLAHLWRESLYCAMMASLPEEELTAFINELATTLVDEARDYVSAATIYAEHLHDIVTAAQLLCRGSKFADAARLLTLHGKKDLVEEIVDSGLAEAMGSMTDLLADCKSQLNAQVPRVRELRQLRAADPLAFFGGDPTGGEGGVDIPDNVSLAPTEATTLAGRTMFTRYTGKTSSSRVTSRTRRREERKRAKGKKGTVYEEEYLVNSIRRLIERVNSTIAEAEALVDALLRRGMRERAAAVEKALADVVTMCTDCRDDVFEIAQATTPKHDENEDAGYEEASLPRPTGGSAVLAESIGITLGGAGRLKEPPVVKAMSKSSLLV
ncbi:putative elongator complex protein 1 [Penicillium ochrochloron]